MREAPRRGGGGTAIRTLSSDAPEALEREAPALREPDLGDLGRRDRDDRVECLVEHRRQLGRGRGTSHGEQRGELGILPVRAREEVRELAVLVDHARLQVLDEGEHDGREGEDAHGEDRREEEQPRRLVQPVVEGRPQQDDERDERRERQHDREPLQAREADDIRGHEPMTEPPEHRHARLLALIREV